MADGTWDFYFTHDGQAPLVVALDLAFGATAPLADLPERLILSVPMRTPMANGLRASAEAPALFALEDALGQTLTAAGYVRVGRVVTRGRTDFIYYGPVGELPALPADRTGDYTLGRVTHTDASWDLYRNFLWPGPHEWQQMQNRKVVLQLREHADRLDQERPIDHEARALDEEAAAAAAEALTAAGFVVTGVAPAEEDTVTIRFGRVDAPARIDAVTAEILAALEGMDDVGYAGWGCAIVTAPA